MDDASSIGSGRHARAAEGPPAWLPIASEWQEKRLPYVFAMRDGLAAAGADVRLDRIGIEPFGLVMLRVRAPVPLVEAAEHWLLRFVRPFDERDEQWACDIFCLLHQRWPEFAVWTGARAEYEALRPRLDSLQEANCCAYPGARYALVGDQRCSLLAYPRGAAEVLSCLPGVRRSGANITSNFHEWIVVDQSFEVGESEGLRGFEQGLRLRGFSTCRYEFEAEGASLLTIHAGDLSRDQLEVRLETALRDVDAAWKARYRPWSWWPGCSVHRHPGKDDWAVREWLERELAGPSVDAMRVRGADEVVLKVPVGSVDRALELLARRFGGDPSPGR